MALMPIPLTMDKVFGGGIEEIHLNLTFVASLLLPFNSVMITFGPSDPIQCIGRSVNELSKRDLLVAVERVNGKTEKLVALELESEGLCVLPSTKAVDATMFYKNDFGAKDGYQFDFALISVLRNLGWTIEAKAIYEEMKGKRLFISRQLFLLVYDELLGIINWSDHLPSVVPSSPSQKPLVSSCMSNRSLFWLLHSNRGSDRTPVDWTTRLQITAGVVRLHPVFHISQLKQCLGDPTQADTGVPIWLYPGDLVRDFKIIKLIWFEAEVLQAGMEERKWIVRSRKNTGADPDDSLIDLIEIYDGHFTRLRSPGLIHIGSSLKHLNQSFYCLEIWVSSSSPKSRCTLLYH
ncbi:hypothetical protein NE237_000659 [Protea cynaroides]|uniref:Uncharacterized protein n=1 Tax=Protea cynaroides TaxID=273540 RepID=A0A9Q0QXE1_9MAGN|nr:hypothetical protein NE237_000659 [Protea cynaroides]